MLIVFDLGLVDLNLRENVIKNIKNVFYWGLGLGELINGLVC
jgi:hypothetical protein